MKPNYRFERAERARSKEAKKAQKREAQIARRKEGDAAPIPEEADAHTQSVASTEDHDVSERTNEEQA